MIGQKLYKTPQTPLSSFLNYLPCNNNNKNKYISKSKGSNQKEYSTTTIKGNYENTNIETSRSKYKLLCSIFSSH